MAVPDFQTAMRPLLALLADGEAHAITAIRDQLATHFELTDDELAERIPSGRVTTFQNRVGVGDEPPLQHGAHRSSPARGVPHHRPWQGRARATS